MDWQDSAFDDLAPMDRSRARAIVAEKGPDALASKGRQRWHSGDLDGAVDYLRCAAALGSTRAFYFLAKIALEEPLYGGEEMACKYLIGGLRFATEPNRRMLDLAWTAIQLANEDANLSTPQALIPADLVSELVREYNQHIERHFRSTK